MSAPGTPSHIQRLGEQAVAAHRMGRLQEAEQLYLQIRKLAPQDFTASYMLGVLRFHAGRDAEAGQLLGIAVRQNPRAIAPLIFLGLVHQRVGRLGDALGCFDRALALDGNLVEALINRGNVLCHMGRFADALAAQDRALRLQPAFELGWYNRGVALRGLGRLADALASFDRALAIRPDYPDALNNRGSTLRELGRAKDALGDFNKVLAQAPRDAVALYNRATALQDLDRLDEALADFDKALAISPGLVAALSNRAVVLQKLNRFAEAVKSFDAALAITPDDAQMLRNRGGLLRALGRFDEALQSYHRALALGPEDAVAWSEQALVLQCLRRHDDALASYDRALAIDPDCTQALYGRGMLLGLQFKRLAASRRDLEKLAARDPDQDYLAGDLLHLRLKSADWDGIEQDFAAMDAAVRAGKRAIRPYVYQAISQVPADLMAASKLYAPPDISTGRGAFSTHDGKIRIGYVSGELREQATAFLTAGLYEAHDKSRFDLIAFDSGWSDGGPTRKRLEAAFDKFIDIAALPDDAAAALIKAERIDILVNLNGYFGLERSGVFARRPAPIQVNYLGFPATLGATYMDYIVADRIVIPDAEQQFYTEQVVTLPDTYQANDSRRPVAAHIPSRTECGLPEGAFVFCNFNHSYKLLPFMFAVWCEILKQVPGSVLWLLESNLEFAERLRRHAEQHGIAGARLIFAPIVQTDRHLARMKQADLFLDSLPYNAHTTASDALWAGLPLLTCRGTAFPGRVATSLLLAMDLPELVTENLEDYQALALRLPREPDRLRALREKLARNRAAAPLFDTARFTRHIEAAYTRMWEIFRRGENPRGFAVDASG